MEGIEKLLPRKRRIEAGFVKIRMPYFVAGCRETVGKRAADGGVKAERIRMCADD
jgi:hypothetical protein